MHIITFSQKFAILEEIFPVEKPTEELNHVQSANFAIVKFILHFLVSNQVPSQIIDRQIVIDLNKVYQHFEIKPDLAVTVR